MKTALTLLAVATVLVAPQASALQSGDEPAAPAVRAGIPASDGELSAEVRLYVGRGDALTSRLRFGTAAREYRRAADVARREGHLASGTTWMVASAYYYDGNLLEAAAALDQLANEAALVGDLPVEALAIYNSAWLNGKAGRGAETETRVARLEGLLRSEYMPVALRERLSGWLKISREVAVGREGQ